VRQVGNQSGLYYDARSTNHQDSHMQYYSYMKHSTFISGRASNSPGLRPEKYLASLDIKPGQLCIILQFFRSCNLVQVCDSVSLALKMGAVPSTERPNNSNALRGA